MKATMAGLTLGLALIGTAAHAEPIHIESAALVFDNQPSYADDRVSVLASSADVLQLSLTEMINRNSSGGAGWSVYDDQGSFAQTSNRYDSGYQLTVREGYRITSIEWNLTFDGQLQQAVSPFDPPGQARNDTLNGMQLTSGGATLLADSAALRDLNGSQQVQVTFNDIGFANQYGLQLQSEIWMGAQGIPPNGILPGIPSFASLNLTGATLTIRTEVSPVPEPATYAMLLGGLALVGGLARRRR
ncbi:PEPxxWA-CTERM sorting domain-containing protein [Pseudoduganella chitinolytica]|uniref:PEPxxWA-CTERM sorting domain-containing protein n=1 Tax=Pseudoduganella chitinolytica TaxID=34070 RepID=A0ABY8BHS0_9BURK|nr:PEPxxWA-CTERM sorting domain-containing protein [Pseudoduganella chitinolytica]WEF35216.1 PEPxxWA-CTERM sorting domain-containing protein [Pseudoduganella chitinolytica]